MAYQKIEREDSTIDIFEDKEGMESQLRFYSACPNVNVIEYGFNMDLGYIVHWNLKGY